MSELVIAFLIIVLLIFAIVLIYMLRLSKKLNVIEAQLSNVMLALDDEQMKSVEQQQFIESIKQSNQTLSLENEQVTKQLDARTKQLQVKITDLEKNLQQIKNEQPEDKLYRRALKMVELGADVEEVMSECELPRAEAELLFSIHFKLND